MLNYELNENGVPFVRCPEFEFLPDQPETGSFVLKLGKSLSFTSLPAVLDEYPESLGLPGMRRPHSSADGMEFSFDADSAIPFESEPAIQRKYRLLDGSLYVQTDFVLRNAFPMRSIVGGGLRIEGAVKFGMICTPEKPCAVELPPMMDFAEIPDGSNLWSCDEPPVILAVEGTDGLSARFQTGGAFWRWINAMRISGKSHYRIVKESGALVFHWDLYQFVPEVEDAQPLPGRNWRITWNVIWGKPEERPAKAKAEFDMLSGDWQKASCTADASGNPSPVPCFSSAGVQNVLKKWLRSQLADALDGDVFVIRHAVPQFCFSAAHMDRPKLKKLAHWDDDDIREFLRWGNRQLRPLGAKVIAVTD